MENQQVDRFVLSANLVNAILQYLVGRPFNEVANIVMAIQQHVAAQTPPDESESASSKQEQ